MTDFPLLESMGLTMMRSHWAGHAKGDGREYVVSANDLEKALASAPVVYECGSSFSGTWRDVCPATPGPHTARLVCVSEIKKESAEDLLREYVQRAGNCSQIMWGTVKEKQDFVDRARKLLGEKS